MGRRRPWRARLFSIWQSLSMQDVSSVEMTPAEQEDALERLFTKQTHPRSDTASTAQGNNLQDTACIETDVLVYNSCRQTFFLSKTSQKRHKTPIIPALLQKQDTDSTAHGTERGTVYSARTTGGAGTAREPGCIPHPDILLRTGTGQGTAPGTSGTSEPPYSYRDSILIIQKLFSMSTGTSLKIRME